MKRADYTGKKFNKLTGIKAVGRSTTGKMYWLFKCECGNHIEAVGANVKAGHTKSCGCNRRKVNLRSL